MRSTMNYQAGDLLLMAFPYVGGAQSKVRPALVLLDMGDEDVLVARVRGNKRDASSNKGDASNLS
jgi:mRNA interferase MazF